VWRCTADNCYTKTLLIEIGDNARFFFMSTKQNQAAETTAHSSLHLMNADELGAGHLDCAETIRAVTAQRDELLAACESVVDTWERDFKGMETGYENTPLESDYKLCKSAIAKVKAAQ
jgi:hypothetical protein